MLSRPCYKKDGHLSPQSPMPGNRPGAGQSTTLISHYALTRLLQYLADQGYYRMREEQFKRTLVLYTLHDAYKDSTLAKTRRGSSEFDVPLSELEALIERMGLRDFAYVTAEDIRAASVSLLS